MNGWRASIVLFAVGRCAAAAPRVKAIKLAVTNPAGARRTAEDVVVPVSALRRIAPDFSAAGLIVTSSGARTLEEDSRTLETVEVPSQADDLDGDGKADEIAFQIDLEAHQTRIVTLAYGEQPLMLRIRSKYPQRTNAKFAKRYEGPGWESEETAWRVYFDARNAIDLFGKRRPGLDLDLFASPEYVYHMESGQGRDIYGIGKALGVGGIGALVNGAALPVADVAVAPVARGERGAGALDRGAGLQGLEDRRPDRGSDQPDYAMGRRARLPTRHHAGGRRRLGAGDRVAEEAGRESCGRKREGEGAGDVGAPGGGLGRPRRRPRIWRMRTWASRSRFRPKPRGRPARTPTTS